MITKLPICDFSQDLISCSQPIDMDDHLMKNVKNPVNKAYADRINYKTTTGIIPNIAMTDNILITFSAAKSFASGKIKIY